jgi:thymidylate synthase
MRYGLTASAAWLNLMERVTKMGSEAYPRGKKIVEVLGATSLVNMQYPVVLVPERKLSVKFLGAEAAWILSGGDDVESIAPFNKRIAEFSDDGVKFAGAYGPKVVAQLKYVVDTLIKDPQSRQAVMTIWRENPAPSKDIPCTVSVQFIIRDGMLHVIDNMRSSDLWLGWPYDVFNFTMIAATVLHMIAAQSGQFYELGDLRLNAGSQHIYEENLPGVMSCLRSMTDVPPEVPFNVFEGVINADDLQVQLWAVTGRRACKNPMLNSLKDAYGPHAASL